MASEQIEVTLIVIEVLERLGVPYLIGGSLASAVHGVARSTLDSDLVVELQPEHAQPLVEALQGHFYLDLETIQWAIQQRSSASLIHLESMFKIDLFISRQRPFDQARFSRRTLHPVMDNPERLAYVCTAEDILLAKLEWYRQGGEVSERQWRDILGILRVQQGRLDVAYLRYWAAELGILDLLDRALAAT